MYLGDFLAGETVDLKWNTTSVGTGSITRATNGSIRIYKNESVTQRTSANGITDTEDFDSLTGLHHLTIDLSDNTDAGFYAAGNDYQVVIQGMIVDGETFNAVIAHFSIENRRYLTAAAVNAEVDTALADYDGPTNAEMVARTLASADYATATALTTVDGVVDAIKLSTDNLPSDPADQSLIIAATDALSTLIGGVPTTAEFEARTLAAASYATASAQTTAQNDLDILTGTDGVTLATSQPNYAPATAASLATTDGKVDDILTDTGTTIPGTITTLQTSVDDLPTNAELTTALGTADDAVLSAVATTDGKVDAIKAKTDSLTFTTANVVDAHIKYVAGEQVTGAGTEGDPWGPA